MIKAWKKFLEELRLQKKVETLTYKGLDMEALKQIATIHEKYIKVILPDRTIIEIWKENKTDDTSGFW